MLFLFSCLSSFCNVYHLSCKRTSEDFLDCLVVALHTTGGICNGNLMLQICITVFFSVLLVR